MGEKAPRKESIGKGDLYFLTHPGERGIFSGYGLTAQPGSKQHLVGLLMVDRPKPVDPKWLSQVQTAFGEYQLVPMTVSGERGIVCQMHISPDSLQHLRQIGMSLSNDLEAALAPLLDHLPRPQFTLTWNESKHLWESKIQSD
jgi:hypothetical protein